MSATTWSIDPLHSEVQFKVKHLVISTVSGSFTKFQGSATTQGDDFENAAIEFSLDTDSISTHQAQRDEHLRSPEFFDTATYPTISFRSTGFKKVSDDQYALTGDLTMKGITKPITLDAEYGGTAKDPWGNIRHGFEVKGVVNRKEFGLTYSALTETGGLALGEDIKFVANIQVAKPA
ncbi:YceI family protein [Fulvivirgaceae bacterium PWU5]|jgi:polyisoprenoid-binding protein YceI|uniref:YceI family protein n=1 Tax=Dawidia cretensis TaxID=2782350 RepID=A0AAP2DW76_9BACT|nr:YceI family protein [Dawidia cretensis]MBT1707147.1 YceI family protein [Dawidia cretensis]